VARLPVVAAIAPAVQFLGLFLRAPMVMQTYQGSVLHLDDPR
jgi:hypothetical protein